MWQARLRTLLPPSLAAATAGSVVAQRIMRCEENESVHVFALRHAQSVANANASKKTPNCWTEDVGVKREDRFRDCALTAKGMHDCLEKAESICSKVFEDNGDGAVLLILSPMLRTILTGALVFSPLVARGHTIHVVVEPAVREVIRAPYYTLENVGRDTVVACNEAREILTDDDAPHAALVLLDLACTAAVSVDPCWYITPTSASALEARIPAALAGDAAVLCNQSVQKTENTERRKYAQSMVRKHVAETNAKGGPPVRWVFIVCHYATTQTLVGVADIARELGRADCVDSSRWDLKLSNLALTLLSGFLDEVE